MATTAQENLPPPLDSKAKLPPLFDGTPRLYISYSCPFAQRAWITRNYKGLQDKIKLVPLNLQDRPAWYKEKVYPVNKVPALEHNGKVIGESLDLIKYVDSNFEGPSLLPDDPEKRKFADELFSHIDTFTNDVYTSFKGDPAKQAGPAFDYLEKALDKFDDGPLVEFAVRAWKYKKRGIAMDDILPFVSSFTLHRPLKRLAFEGFKTAGWHLNEFENKGCFLVIVSVAKALLVCIYMSAFCTRQQKQNYS
ncbi:hypothetical protein KPL71_014915 [Citrus sinensis]|uniref:Uncharacterized protein n=1 Tax=Citrus sinensis TaxID=2711 RepID=A0ACB8KF48_CITSI|nr:hypothetical protein KPL71_014915 [Citrus sinensis]